VKKVIKKLLVNLIERGDLMTKFKLAMFDMDGTLLKGRTIFVFAHKKGFMDGLLNIINSDRISYEKSIKIAKLLKGMSGRELLKIYRDISLQEHVETVIKKLKNKGITTAIATNSYQFVADDLKDRLGFDYAFANNLIIDNDVVTGELEINNKNLTKHCDGCKIHSICKEQVLESLCKKLGIKEEEVIAVGDGEIDNCMLKRAGLGVAFNASEKVQQHADVSTSDMSSILNYI